MTLTFLAIPTHIGPGYILTIGGFVGPIPTDDLLVVNLLEHASGNNWTFAAREHLAAGFNGVTIGLDQRTNVIAPGELQYVAQGAAIDCQAFQYHANGTLVDSSAFTAFGVADLFTYAWCLLRYAGGVSSPAIAAILAAVARDMPSLP